MRKRLYGLDTFRVLSAFVVLLFHAAIHVDCDFGILQPFIEMGAIFMTGFFMLSGYSLFYVYEEKNLSIAQNIVSFYKKRLIGILPMYYFVALLYVFFLGEESLLKNIVLMPVEVLGIQSVYASLFDVSHNGGTWFISCILICYLLFPLVLNLIRFFSEKQKIVLFLIFSAILLYSPFVVELFDLQTIYSNPFFRILEFVNGMIIASSMKKLQEIKIIDKLVLNNFAFFIELLLLIIGVTIALEIGIPKNYMLYSWIGLPMFSLMLMTASCAKIGGGTAIIRYLSKISYAIFLSQFFVWKIIKRLNIESNIMKIFSSVILCVFISVLINKIIDIFSRKVFKNGMKK